MCLHYQQMCSIHMILMLSVDLFCLFACLHLLIYSLSFWKPCRFCNATLASRLSMYGHVLLVPFEPGFLLWLLNLWKNCLNSWCWWWKLSARCQSFVSNYSDEETAVLSLRPARDILMYLNARGWFAEEICLAPIRSPWTSFPPQGGRASYRKVIMPA